MLTHLIKVVDGAAQADHVTQAEHLLGVKPSLPDIYAKALIELRGFDTKPLCHRVAARNLINNCQLLDGKGGDADLLVDGGGSRQVADFVDSFSASLAICDLERAGFDTHAACTKFREDAIAKWPLPSKPRLHVTSREIGACLAALAKSDAAWTTFMSYKMKASYFCEAARSDVEKGKWCLVSQVFSKLTQADSWEPAAL